MPNGSASTLHLAITDNTGNTAVLEYLNGKLEIHEGKEYQVMTNSPKYSSQLAINDYWKEIGGLQMLPGTNRSSDRFVRASFYIHAIPQTPRRTHCRSKCTECDEKCICSLRHHHSR